MTQRRPSDQQEINASRQSQPQQQYGSPVQVSYHRPLKRAEREDEAPYPSVEPSAGAAPYPSDYDAEAPRPSRTRRPRRPGSHRGLKILLAIVAVVVIGYIVVFGPIDRKVAFTGSEKTEVSSKISPSVPLTPYYALLLGSDSRDDGEPARTDTIMLARVDPLMNKVTLISIPRDTRVELEGHGTQKINAAYAFDGVAGTVEAVESLTGQPISQVAIIDFNGLTQLIDAIGGITVNVPVAVNDPQYTGLVLPAGPQQMDGKTALLFSRVRHGFDYGDFQRQADQQLVIQAIVDKLRADPTLMPAAAESLSDVLHTSYHCYDLIPLLARMAVQSPTIYSASIPATTKDIEGVSYVIADESALRTLMDTVNAGKDPSTVTNGLQL